MKTIHKTEMAKIKGGEMENLSLIKQIDGDKFAFFTKKYDFFLSGQKFALKDVNFA